MHVSVSCGDVSVGHVSVSGFIPNLLSNKTTIRATSPASRYYGYDKAASF